MTDSEPHIASLARKTGTISITRCTSLEPDVYAFALAAFKLLFAPRAADPSAIPADLVNFEQVYCSATNDGCFLVARDTASLPTSPGPPVPLTPGARHIPTEASQGRIVGIVAYRPYIPRFRDDASGTLRPELQWSSEKTVEVVRLFVAPECRGQGLAQRLIDVMKVEADVDGVEVLYLHTQPFLTGAEALWRKMGWTLISRDTDSWESIHMYKKI
jgi:GNAT superfamily N-acetyltransferase